MIVTPNTISLGRFAVSAIYFDWYSREVLIWITSSVLTHCNLIHSFQCRNSRSTSDLFPAICSNSCCYWDAYVILLVNLSACPSLSAGLLKIVNEFSWIFGELGLGQKNNRMDFKTNQHIVNRWLSTIKISSPLDTCLWSASVWVCTPRVSSSSCSACSTDDSRRYIDCLCHLISTLHFYTNLMKF